jgi:hypothetical protein
MQKTSSTYLSWERRQLVNVVPHIACCHLLERSREGVILEGREDVRRVKSRKAVEGGDEAMVGVEVIVISRRRREVHIKHVALGRIINQLKGVAEGVRDLPALMTAHLAP